MSATTLPAPAPARQRPARRRLTRAILWANLVAQVAIVVTGGAVRLTGSGLGCSTWPECEPGEFTPVLHEATTWHPWIEFGNRTLTGVLLVLAVATAWAVLRQSRPRTVMLLGVVPVVGVLAQAVLGGVTVLVELHPAVVGVHFLLSMVLVSASTALLLREREPDSPAVWSVDAGVRRLSLLLAPLVLVVLGLGVVVTGSGPHSGDAERAARLDLDPALVSRVHAGSVWLYLAAVVVLLVLLHRQVAAAAAPGSAGSGDLAGLRRARRGVLVLLAVGLAQGLIGYVQYFTGLPVVLVGAHMLGAALLVAAQTAQWFTLRSRITQAPEAPAPATADALTS